MLIQDCSPLDLLTLYYQIQTKYKLVQYLICLIKMYRILCLKKDHADSKSFKLFSHQAHRQISVVQSESFYLFQNLVMIAVSAKLKRYHFISHLIQT